jgi:ankyrin repeat protein
MTLLEAVQCRNLEEVKRLLKAGADIHAEDGLPLKWAASYGYDEIVKVLIKAKVNVNVQNNNGFSAIGFAANGGHLETVKLLIDAGADVKINKNSPLKWALKNKHLAVIKLLLENGADKSAIEDFDKKLMEMI